MVARARARARGVGLVWVAAPVLVLLAGVALAQSGDAAPVGGPVDDAEVPADLAEVVAELDALDQPLALRDLQAAAPGPRAISVWGHGQGRWRLSALAIDTRQDGRFELAAGRLYGRAAVRLRPGQAPLGAGGVRLALGPCGLWAGRLTLRHGFGLLAADPGRRSSLAADQGLGGVRGGLSVRTAAGDAEPGLHVGCDGRWGAWEMASMWNGPGSGAGSGALRVGRREAAGEWAVQAKRDPTGTGAGFCGRLSRSTVAFNGEVAVRRAGTGPGTMAGVAGFAWRPAPGFVCEMQAGATSGAWDAPVSVLAGGARSGWAIRAGWGERGKGGLDLLLQGARSRPDLTTPRRRATQVADLAWERRAGPGWTLLLRVRHVLRQDTAWSERYPWQTGIPGAAVTRTSLSAQMEWERAAGRLTGQWRSFTAGAQDGSATRHLARLGWRRAWMAGWSFWAETAAAWGEPADLVSGLNPLPGMVVARHWGHWRSENMVGGAVQLGCWDLRAAVARRLPDPASGVGSAATLEGWLEAAASW